MSNEQKIANLRSFVAMLIKGSHEARAKGAVHALCDMDTLIETLTGHLDGASSAGAAPNDPAHVRRMSAALSAGAPTCAMTVGFNSRTS